MKTLFFLILFSFSLFSQNKNLGNIYLDNNNVTIKCEKSIIGDKKKIKGKKTTMTPMKDLSNLTLNSFKWSNNGRSFFFIIP